jgi:hypothetical protein
MEFPINKDDSLSESSSSDSSTSSLPVDLVLPPLPPTETACVNDTTLIELSVLSLLLQITSELQSLISSLSSDDDSLSLHPKIGLIK